MTQHRFRAVLATPRVLPVTLAYVLARLSSTMIALSVLLSSQHRTGSFLSAGALAGAFALAAAALAPVLGQLVDQRGPTRVLLMAGATQSAALVGLALAPTWLSLPLALMAGAASPPVTSFMRALWPTLLPEPLQDTGWALEGVIVEATELCGPLLVAAVTLLTGPRGGSASLLVSAALGFVGCGCFATASASRSWRSQRSAGRLRTTAPLRLLGVRRIVIVVALASASLSATEVAVAAFVTDLKQASSSGLLFAVWLSGSLLGGWWYGARSWSGRHGRRLAIIMGLGALTAGLPAVAAAVPTTDSLQAQLLLGAALAVCGVFIAPTTAAQFAILTRAAPELRRTESFTWASTAAYLGVAGGAAASGLLIQQVGPWLGMAMAAGVTAIGALVSLVSRRSWDEAPEDEGAAKRVIVPDAELDRIRRHRMEIRAWRDVDDLGLLNGPDDHDEPTFPARAAASPSPVVSVQEQPAST